MLTKEAKKYMKEHPFYNAWVHVVTGVGIGALLTYPIFGQHPLRWGIVLIGLGVLGHFYPAFRK